MSRAKSAPARGVIGAMLWHVKKLRAIARRLDPRETDLGTSVELGTVAVLTALLMRWMGA
jgi:hypothetical protein